MGEAIVVNRNSETLSGISTGGVLTITAPPGATIVATKGNETYTKVSVGTGKAVFENLSDGLWNITATKGNVTNQLSIDVNVDYTSTVKFKGVPAFTYTGGTYKIVDDSDNAITDTEGNWKIRFLTSGTLTFTNLKSADSGIDVFCVGGGANGSTGADGSSNATKYYGGNGGGGGKTSTGRKIKVTEGTAYTITVGGASGTSSAFGVSAAGGSGKNGGSGGGNGTSYGTAVKGGSDGASASGSGQGTTTREFGESGKTLYSGGGGGGAGRYGASYGDEASGGSGGGGKGGGPYEKGVNGTTNLGGGGGGGGMASAGKGGSGIVIIRNAR